MHRYLHTHQQERRIQSEVESLERDTGFKLRVLAQNYPETPGVRSRPPDAQTGWALAFTEAVAAYAWGQPLTCRLNSAHARDLDRPWGYLGWGALYGVAVGAGRDLGTDRCADATAANLYGGCQGSGIQCSGPLLVPWGPIAAKLHDTCFTASLCRRYPCTRMTSCPPALLPAPAPPPRPGYPRVLGRGRQHHCVCGGPVIR